MGFWCPTSVLSWDFFFLPLSSILDLTISCCFAISPLDFLQSYLWAKFQALKSPCSLNRWRVYNSLSLAFHFLVHFLPGCLRQPCEVGMMNISNPYFRESHMVKLALVLQVDRKSGKIGTKTLEFRPCVLSTVLSWYTCEQETVPRFPGTVWKCPLVRCCSENKVIIWNLKV